jgi:serine protease Do
LVCYFCIVRHPLPEAKAVDSIKYLDNGSTPFSETENTDILLSSLFNRTKESLVQIQVTVQKQNPHIMINGSPLVSPDVSLGSGFIYDKEGHIVTNAHVVLDASIIEVRFLNGNSYLAKLIGEDLYADLAVLSVDPSALSKESIKPLTLGNSSRVRVGQQVIAIGNPQGLTGSMTVGIVSQTNRVMEDILTKRFFVSGLIQTDAAITHGNSGGPLLNMKGEAVGVTQRGEQSEEGKFSQPGISFAIPSNTVTKVIPSLISQGIYAHAWLGVHIIDVSPKIAEVRGIKEARGVIVVQVSTASPAESSGIQSGSKPLTINFETLNYDADIITGIDNIIIRERSDLINYVDSKSPGDDVKLRILRDDGGNNTVDIKLARRPNL